ncbi:MAG: hypothetical protein H0V44_05260 [Planctomycetes bacterium]|nr:hypothetical protein [Planctomycetota bacterium]
MLRYLSVPVLLTWSIGAALVAADASDPLAGPVVEPSTQQSLGFHWIIRGDDDADARITVAYRTAGAAGAAWKDGAPLLRVRKGAHAQAGKEKHRSDLDVPADGWLFAGSVLMLDPKSEYEVKLSLVDADGGSVEKLVKAGTTAEPTLPPAGTVVHVAPGSGGGRGTSSEPFLGLEAAQAAAKPGMRFVLAAGIYAGTALFAASGEPGKPIVWHGPDDGEAILDGKGSGDSVPARVVSANEIHDVWFRKLTIRNAEFGMVLHGAQRIVIQRCRLSGVGYGITCHDGPKGPARDLVISDNVLVGEFKWILPFHGIPEGDAQWKQEKRGIEVTGTGHEVCYNRISYFKDAIDTAPSSVCADIDFHHNDISQVIDDGIEMDGSDRNTRCFLNRITDCHTGISIQPVFGGPVYIFRNTLFNTNSETLKMHNCPSGVRYFHNTTVKKAEPFLVSTGDKVSDCWFRNNIFIGTSGRALNLDCPQAGCDFDFDGFGGWSGDVFLKFDGVKYATPEEAKAKAPIETHAVLLDPATTFASGLVPPSDAADKHDPVEFDLKPGSPAIDGGEILPGLNDGFAGKAPDIGAREVGAPPVHYGPRPEKK